MFGRDAPGKKRAEIYALDILKAQLLVAWSQQNQASLPRGATLAPRRYAADVTFR